MVRSGEAGAGFRLRKAMGIASRGHLDIVDPVVNQEPVDHIHTGDYLSENGIATIKVRLRGLRDKKL